MKTWSTLFAVTILSLNVMAQERINDNKFRQLKQELATPNVYRTAAGAPGHEYYQQRADYRIQVTLDDEKQTIKGKETITYYNNSPDPLNYLWLQLDQNMRAQDSDTRKIRKGTVGERVSFSDLRRMQNDFDGGFKLESVTLGGKPANYTINKTMMRIDLATPLKPNSSISFEIAYWYNINNRDEIGGRSGYEYFKENDNYLYTIAQFFPRMAVYNDVEGWQNKQFLGRGEFTLPFGNYQVEITVPEDHVVAATGELQNAGEVLTSEQRSRMSEARNERTQPVFIVTEEEARETEKGKKTGTKTWKFKATNVRDFGFASSRKFIWDAMGVEINGKTVMAMSFYPKEGNPLWEQYSTKVVAHTLRVYSKYTVDYPYPVAQSIHAKRIGMEYPMICFNGGRPEKDGTYAKATKYAMIGVIIHEVGHNFFPMIINSDERQWTWMDEGLNTFVQYLTEQEFEPNYPSRRGPAPKIVDYMKGDPENITPIMTNSESIYQFGNNAYGKPATALNILRETVMGRELFDHAFKTYCETWKFKHPTPADFFRTMEDASAVDLDWYWRSWFYTTDYVDLGISDIKRFRIDSREPNKEKSEARAAQSQEPVFIGESRNKSLKTYMEEDGTLADFYTSFDPLDVTMLDEEAYQKYFDQLNQEEIALLNSDYNYYQVSFTSPGGIPMPLILEFTFTDGTSEVQRIPAEIWKRNDKEITKVFYFEKELSKLNLDPFLETADVDRSNNNWPPQAPLSKFKLYKQHSGAWGAERENPMQKHRRMEEMKNGEQLQEEPK